MAEYKYKGITNSGETVEGTLEAESEKEVLEVMKSQSLRPLEVKKVSMANKDLDIAFLDKVTNKDLSVFCRQFSTMLDAGATVLEAIEVISEQTLNKKLREALEEVAVEIQKGGSFSENIQAKPDIFPGLLSYMIEAGETSGTLDSIMDRMSVYYEKDTKTGNRIRSAMIYPMVLGVVTFAVVVLMLVMVLPQFVTIFEGANQELPLPTRFLLGVSNLVIQRWYIIFPAIAGIIFGINRWTKTKAGRRVVDKLKFKLPMIKGPVKDIAAARYTSTMSILFSSGIPLLDALEITSGVVQNVILQEKLENAIEEIKKGETLAGAMQEIEEFPLMMQSMIVVGEQSGSLDTILNKTAAYYDEEVDTAMDRLVSLVEPIMIVIMAIIVGGIVIAIALPMFGMVDAITGSM